MRYFIPDTAPVTVTDHVDVPQSTPPKSDLLDTDEICAALKISKRTLATLRKKKLIPFVKLGPRILRYSLPTILRARATGMRISR